MAISLTGRDDADDIAFRSEAVADHENSQTAAQAKQDKSVFLFRVVRVVYELAVFVREDCLRVLKAHPLLAQVCSRFFGISLESKRQRSVRTMYIQCKTGTEWCLCGLTFELSGQQRQTTNPGPVTPYSVPPAQAW